MTDHIESAKRFLGSYFHQDWEDEFTSVADAVAYFRGRTSPDNQKEVRDAIATLINEMKSGMELDSVKNECYIVVENDVLFLENIFDLLKD